MPKKEEEKKKFKTVTEEVTPVEVPEEKSGFVVPETNNIDLTSKVAEKGVFLRIFLVTFLATLLAFLLAGGIYVYLTKTKALDSVKPNVSPTLTPLASSIPVATSTPQANVDLTTFKISVLNGSGGIGIATAAKQIIEKAGFKVASIGNAESFDFTDTIIQVKPGVEASVVAKLKDALSAKYSVKIGTSLDVANTYDIVVTVGSK